MAGVLVLLRHGETTANAAGVFTGWSDPELSAQGRHQAHRAGRLLARSGLTISAVHTSVLTRATHTTRLVMNTIGPPYPPLRRSWRLNERHYGALTGRNKVEVRAQVGESTYQAWRNSLTLAPPPMPAAALTALRADPRYRGLSATSVPASESLGDTLVRLLPYWHQVLAPQLHAGATVLLIGHGNALRALAVHLDGLTQTELTALRIAPGAPLRYEFTSRLQPRHRGGRPVTAT